MSSVKALDQLTAMPFLDEIHHLLWLEPAENNGAWDEGWNCRDHALISGIVAQVFGMTASVIYGEAIFVQGPSGHLPPVGLSQASHAWLKIDGQGSMDLSPRLTMCVNKSWRPWPLSCIAMNRCLPDGDFKVARSPDEFERLIAAATHSSGRLAIYFGRGYDQIDLEFVSKAFEFVNSPLTDELSQKYEPTLYAKAAIHLFKFLRGENKSLRHLTQQGAWESIAQQPENPIEWLKVKRGFR
jgi:hypothetical protein